MSREHSERIALRLHVSGEAREITRAVLHPNDVLMGRQPRDEIGLERKMHVLRNVVEQHWQRALVSDAAIVCLERRRRHGGRVIVWRDYEYRVRAVVTRDAAALHAQPG